MVSGPTSRAVSRLKKKNKKNKKKTRGPPLAEIPYALAEISTEIFEILREILKSS